MSTEQVCRTLRAYRKKLHSSTDYPRGAKELERELNLTVHALGERAARHSPSPDTEVDSSEKENKDNHNSNSIVVQKHGTKKQTSSSSTSSTNTSLLAPSAKLTKVARRMPSTPLLSTRSGTRQVSRSRSLDADGEG